MFMTDAQCNENRKHCLQNIVNRLCCRANQDHRYLFVTHITTLMVREEVFFYIFLSNQDLSNKHMFSYIECLYIQGVMVHTVSKGLINIKIKKQNSFCRLQPPKITIYAKKKLLFYRKIIVKFLSMKPWNDDTRRVNCMNLFNH